MGYEDGRRRRRGVVGYEDGDEGGDSDDGGEDMEGA